MCRLDFWLDDLGCLGNETNIGNCGGHNGLGYHNCGNTECVRLVCEEAPAPPSPPQLIHSPSGIITITYEGEQRSICDDGFGEADVAVACS
jgi:hypothetical protein